MDLSYAEKNVSNPQVKAMLGVGNIDVEFYCDIAKYCGGFSQ